MTEHSKATDRKTRWEQLMRDAIVTAVVQVLTEDGMEKLTMERVAQRAGVAKGTLYAYFHDKNELVESAVQAAFDPLAAALDEIVAREAAPAEKLEEMVRTHLAFFEEHRETLRILLFERQRAWRHQRPRGERYRLYVSRLAAVIEEGADQGRFRSSDPHKVAGMLADACSSLVADRLFGDDETPLDDDVRLVTQTFLNGIEVVSP